MTKLLLVGCGKMGGALLAGWLDRGFRGDDIVVVHPHAAQAPADGATRVASPAAVPAAFVPDVVVFAVKPQMMDAVAPLYAAFAKSAVVLSIAAGKTLAYYRRQFGDAVAVVRAMPNTPAAVGRGMTVAVASPTVDAAARTLCGDLLAAVGDVAWIDDEAQMDAVTAVSGSGPAYVFLLAETLAEAGVEAGLPADLAARLARATVAGSGELLARSADEPAVLRRNVTSPQGTTFAALEVLMAPDGMKALLARAVAAAARRSRELAG